MPRRLAVGRLILFAMMTAALASCSCRQAEPASLSSSKTQQASAAAEEIPLPPPRTSGDVSLEEALDRRYSFREFSDKEISLEQIAQVLWAGAGIPAGVDAVSGATRLPPSAGATYPTDLYLVAGRVTGLRPGVYAYNPGAHALKLTKSGDLRRDVSETALGQSWLSTAPALVVIAGTYPRVTQRYGERGVRYAFIEAGCVAQNLCLQATVLNLGSAVVGAYYDDQLREILELPADPLLIVALGR